jgi:rSAM/selenodomain-associated transferase 1
MRSLDHRDRVHLIVIAKAPIAGRVKTRLCPPYSLHEAAVLAEAALSDTLAAVAATPAAGRTIVLDGPVGPWLPSGFSVLPQRGNGLDERLAAAFTDAQRNGSAPVLLVGMDTPQVTPSLLSAASQALTSEGTDAVLGPADDGGWWCLGLRCADPQLLLGVPMSTSHTWADQDQRLRAHGLRVTALPTLVDVDDAASAVTVAQQAPFSRFANTLTTLVMAS